MDALRLENDYTEDDYYNLPEDERAELIDGMLYDMASPSRIHQKVLNAINNTIYNYIRSRGGSCEVYPAPFAVRLFDDKKTVVEPDISVICDPKKLTDKGCSGAPDWIIEVLSPTTASHDHVRKLALYERAGVREYWIADPLKKRVYVYFLEKESFNVDTYTFEDRIQARIYDDLYIDFSALDI